MERVSTKLPFHIITSAQLPGHSIAVFSDSVSKLLSFLLGHPDMTYLSLLIIIMVSLPGISRGPCNNWHYLGHDRHVDNYDDDGNDCVTTSNTAMCKTKLIRSLVICVSINVGESLVLSRSRAPSEQYPHLWCGEWERTTKSIKQRL